MIIFVFVKKVMIFGYVGRWIYGNGVWELLVLRFVVINFIIDLWIYIFFRKEIFIVMKRYSRGFCKILFDRLDIFIEFGILEFILNEVSGCGKSMEKIIFIDD